MMQEHLQLIKRASAEEEDSWTSQHKFLKHFGTVAQTLM
jgi:hypothetical protein